MVVPQIAEAGDIGVAGRTVDAEADVDDPTRRVQMNRVRMVKIYQQRVSTTHAREGPVSLRSYPWQPVTTC